MAIERTITAMPADKVLTVAELREFLETCTTLGATDDDQLTVVRYGLSGGVRKVALTVVVKPDTPPAA